MMITGIPWVGEEALEWVVLGGLCFLGILYILWNSVNGLFVNYECERMPA